MGINFFFLETPLKKKKDDYYMLDKTVSKPGKKTIIAQAFPSSTKHRAGDTIGSCGT